MAEVSSNIYLTEKDGAHSPTVIGEVQIWMKKVL